MKIFLFDTKYRKQQKIRKKKIKPEIIKIRMLVDMYERIDVKRKKQTLRKKKLPNQDLP